MNGIEKAKEIRRVSESPYLVRAKVDDLIAEMEAEKPAEDALTVVEMWCLEHSGKYESAHVANIDLARHIQNYAESYHTKKCVECKKVEPRKYYPLGQEPIPIDGSEHGYEGNDE